MKKNSLNNKGFFIGRRTLLVVFLLLLVPLLGMACNAGPAEDYSPIFYFEGEETCYPVTAQYHLDNSVLMTDDDTGISYYDNTQTSIIDHYTKQNLGHTVYYHEYEENGDKIIQYWMFYAFNKGDLNQHEGDWEMVQVVIPASGSKWVAYSQHHSGQYATWDQVEKDGKNIKVYVARGSHANYLRSYSGKLGIASDTVGDSGKVLKYGTGSNNYELVEITDTSPDWIAEDALWGDYGGPQDGPLGRNGPPGPMFRGIEEGNQMWNGLTWGNSIPKADNTFFIGEWFMYNFAMIFILITIIFLALIIFKIYRRHKKHGLGPRILSMLYIDGLNLKSIGNIIFFVGLILAIIGLFSPWYSVSADINVEGAPAGMFEVLSIDGMNGVQITIPGITGAVPMGNVLLPLSLVLGIGIVFFFLACVGIPKSVKLGLKYIIRGFRFMIPIIIIIIIIALLASLIGPMAKDMQGGDYAIDMFNSISGSPMGGEETFTVDEGGITGQFATTWGLGSGGYYLLLSGTLLLVAGAMEVFANKEFFTPKTPIGKPKKEKPAKAKKEPAKEETPAEKKDEANVKSCPKCGGNLEPNEKFCAKCGEKI